MKRATVIALLLLPLLLQGQVLLHIPADKLDAPVLFGSRIVDVNQSWGKVFAPGQRNAFPQMMHFHLDSAGHVALVPDELRPHREEGRGRGRGKRLEHVRPLHFPLVERAADGSLTVDAGEYFSSYPAQVSAIPPKMLEKEVQLSGEVLSVSETPEYLQVTGKYLYASGLEVTAACYFLFLPREPMPAKRVRGYNSAERSPRGDSPSQRWNLACRPEIVFYVDKAFPEAWFPYIKEGVEDWNRAFEAAGLGPVLQALPEPDSLERNSPLVNMVRYMDVEEANAKGDVLCDPRSGEILQGDILWWKNVVDLNVLWRYAQTGAADPAARLEEYPLEVLGPMIRYAVCHEMGHVLGLGHNMGASWSYPTDSLRSPSFTREHGTTASVMDYARYNHLATAEDVAADVKLLPPRLGPYDYYVIACGYGATEAEPGEYCYYAPPVSAAISPDPSAQAETLGNDLLASSAAGLRNCRALLALDGLTDERIKFLKKQYYRYIWLSLSNFGGSVQGVAVPWEEYEKTFAFVLEGLLEVPEALKDPVQAQRILDELWGNFLPERVYIALGEKAFKRYERKVNILKKKYNKSVGL